MFREKVQGKSSRKRIDPRWGGQTSTLVGAASGPWWVRLPRSSASISVLVTLTGNDHPSPNPQPGVQRTDLLVAHCHAAFSPVEAAVYVGIPLAQAMNADQSTQ